MSEQTFNIALVGLGFGAEFIPIHQAHPNANLVAVCRRNEAEMNAVADQFGIAKRYTDYEKLLADPSAINTDKYGDGWLFEVEPAAAELPLLTPAEYIEHLDGVWKITQQTIKGQLND